MTSIYDEPIPGTTLKNLIEQDDFLRKFMGMIRRRFELDKDYTESLRALRASADPRWAESAVQPVVSPFLNLLDKEIDLRENTTNTLFITLDKLPPIHFPNEHDEEGITPLTKYEELQTSYEEYLLKFREVNTQESIASLQAWYQTPREEEFIGDMTVNEIGAYVFPEVDRKYRESVINQRRISQMGLMWHKDYLPGCIEAHQQRVEEVKLMLGSAAIEYSRLASQIVQALAAFTEGTSNISSSKYIAPLHILQEREVEHTLIQPVVYRNFYTDGEAAHPMFGLPLSEDYLKSLSKHYHRNAPLAPPSIKHIFEVEKQTSEAICIHDLVKRKDPGIAERYIIASFVTIPPLISLPTELLTRNSDNWERNRLTAPMKTVSSWARRYVEQNLHTLYYPNKRAAALWCHNPEAQHFLWAIYRKWDFKNDCPFPDGVVRGYDAFAKPKLFWKKTGDRYYPP